MNHALVCAQGCALFVKHYEPVTLECYAFDTLDEVLFYVFLKQNNTTTSSSTCLHPAIDRHA